MNPIESFKMALSNIRASKMRSFLTMLGIIIGVAAVIVIVGLGNGMQNYMAEQFESIGTNILTVSIISRGSRTLSEEKMYEIVEEAPAYLDRVSPGISMNSPVKIGTEFATRTSVTGVSEEYFDIRSYSLTQGRGLLYTDVLKREKVCVIGSYVNQEYFGGRGLGEKLRIGGSPFKVVGVLAESVDSTEGSDDDAIYVPYSTAARLSGKGMIDAYIVTVADVDTASESKEYLEDELYKVFHDEDAYMVMSMAEMLDMMNQMVNVVITILAVIAGISLVVGGIGIMNIMLVSVTERTREIGIRKAMGAKERYIMSQFVIEAATTSALGGALGILFGEGLSSLATFILSMFPDMPITVAPSLNSILFAVGISVGIGVLFGYLPAKKAALLNPIDALRYE